MLGNLGTASVAAFYSVAVFTGGSLPQYLAGRLGTKRALLFSGLIYTFYVYSLVYTIVPLMFLATCLNGVAAAVLSYDPKHKPPRGVSFETQTYIHVSNNELLSKDKHEAYDEHS